MSLKVVGSTIVGVLSRLGFQARLFTWQVPVVDALREFDRAVVFMPFAPVYVPSWVLMHRDYVKRGIVSVFYTTVEGVPKRALVPDWIRRDEVFVANSEFTRDMLERVGVRVERVVPHGIDFGELEGVGVDEDFRRRMGGRVLFGVVANSHPRKGLAKLGEAIKMVAREVPDARFFVVTEVEGGIQLDRPPNTVVSLTFGKVSRRSILSTIASFDFYVCCSLSEGFCLPVLEAQALGVPVIYPDYKPLSEVASPRGNISFETSHVRLFSTGEGVEYTLHQYDPKVLADAIVEAYHIAAEDRDRYLAMRRDVRRWAERFNADVVYRELVV